MIKRQQATAMLLMATIFSTSALAQTSSILIERKHNKYPYQCHAHECFSPDAEKNGRLKNAKDLVDQYCSRSWRMATGKEGCEREQEDYAAMEQCLRIECIKAVCKKIDLLNNRCVSGAYFK
jgi:hypothetical protein